MVIFHALFSTALGGVEQAFISYTEALLAEKHDVYVCIHKDCPFKHLLPIGIHGLYEFSGAGSDYDLLLLFRIFLCVRKLQPDVIIAHANRTIALMRHIKNAPLIAVNHSYNVKRSLHSEALIGVNRTSCKAALALGHKEEDIFYVPNMVKIPPMLPYTISPTHRPFTLGVLSRLVVDKNVDIILKAVALLHKSYNILCKVIIGGEGPEKENLQKLADMLHIAQHVSFQGWVDNKAQFFQQIDISCLASSSEVFGIVILEAWAHNIPMIASNAEGPRHLMRHLHNGLLFPIGDEKALAESIALFYANPALRQTCIKNGYAEVKEHYVQEKIGQRLTEIIETTLEKYTRRVR